jgi:glycosyltransferase involved in cell wall biosynthesis
MVPASFASFASALFSSGAALEHPERLTDVLSWHGHIPFAFWLVERLEPRLLIELGTHKGDSYCAFTQAVDRFRLPTRCYAVDTWRGDPQAGLYGEDVYEELQRYHQPRFSAFSRLVRSTFDEAVEHFADKSIDLLHIDGLHTYDAVRHDFETWKPKLSERAVVLLHDINVRENDFGVWRYWEELRSAYPGFEFLHSHGLGVLAVGPQRPTALDSLFRADGRAIHHVRKWFAALGERWSRAAPVLPVASAAAEAEAEAEAAKTAQAAAAKIQEAAAANLAAAQEREAERAAQAAVIAQLEERVSDLEVLRAQAVFEAEASRAQIDAYRAEAARLQKEATWLQNELTTRGPGADTPLKGSRSSRLTSPLRKTSKRFPRLSAAVKTLLAAVYWASKFQLVSGMGRRKLVRLLTASGLIDAEFYLARYPDVAMLGHDPVIHYLLHGAREGRDPNPWFSTSYYVQHYRDVLDAGVNPLLHYLMHGGTEGRRPGPEFDGEAYLRRYPDVAASRMNPLSHFLLFGRAEGRRPLGDEPPQAQLPAGVPKRVGSADPSDVVSRAKQLSRAHDAKPSILIVDYRLPTPDLDSGSVRMLALVRLFVDLGYSVTFVSDFQQEQVAYERPLTALGVGVLYGFASAEDHLQVDGARYRLVLLSRPSVAERYTCLARAKAIFADLVYDTVDLHWLRYQRAAELHGDPQLAAKAQEQRKLEEFSITSADRVFAVTQTEKEKILAEWPGADVLVLPNIHRCTPLPRPRSQRKGLMFIGGYEHEPNVDAVTWFVTDVLPLIVKDLPEMRFKIVGSKPPKSLNGLVSESVELVGYVKNPEPYFDEAMIFVAPLRYGAGMKGKIGQAMSLGLPVVTTTIGAEGMLLVDGTHALIADTPAEFAAAVVRLYHTEALWEELRRQALAHIETNFSEKAVGGTLRSTFGLSAQTTRGN